MSCSLLIELVFEDKNKWAIVLMWGGPYWGLCCCDQNVLIDVEVSSNKPNCPESVYVLGFDGNLRSSVTKLWSERGMVHECAPSVNLTVHVVQTLSNKCQQFLICHFYSVSISEMHKTHTRTHPLTWSTLLASPLVSRVYAYLEHTDVCMVIKHCLFLLKNGCSLCPPVHVVLAHCDRHFSPVRNGTCMIISAMHSRRVACLYRKSGMLVFDNLEWMDGWDA